MSDPRRRSALGHRNPLTATEVHVSECPFFDKQILRVAPAVAVKAKLELPTANLTMQVGNTQVLWLGPDEWMFVTPPHSQSEVIAEYSEKLTALHHLMSDVSDYYTIIRIAGENSGPLLMKLSTLDLHPREFKSGAIAGSVFGKANAWLVKGDEGGQLAFDLFVRWSMADYLWCLVAEAGREFGLPTQTPRGQEKGLRYKNT